MAFMDLIKTPRLDRVLLRPQLGEPLEGTLNITSHHLIVTGRDTPPKEFWLLHSNVDSVERRLAPSGGTLVLKCKDFRILELDIRGIEEFSNVSQSIERLSTLDNIEQLYPFYYREPTSPSNGSATTSGTLTEKDDSSDKTSIATAVTTFNGWNTFQPEEEISKLKMYTDDWRLSYVNRNYQVCPTYPEAVIVPRNVDDSSLIEISKFRYMGRFPVLAYYHRSTKAALMRSSQPMVGTNSKRCKDDEKLINTVLGSGKRGYIIETRTQNLAQLARNKGGGFEPEVHYPLWRRVHKPIDRHSTLLDSLSRLIEACADTGSTSDKWLSRLESSGWLSHIKDVLMCACLVAQCIHMEGASVLVHGTEGMDSTLQVSSLAQVILDPDCRTITGFQALIEREWLEAGHPFATRCKFSAYNQSPARSREQSPTFLVFLDCVYQIYYQFSASFEFNDKYLLFLFENTYSSHFGTFLANCTRERRNLSLANRTVSIWSYVNRPEVIQSFQNPLYEPNSRVTWPSVAPHSLELWPLTYLRWVVDLSPQEEALARIAQIKWREKQLRSQAAKLKRQMLELIQSAH